MVGRWFRHAGVHYQFWQVVTDAIVPSAYSRACKQCFPRGFPLHDGLPPERVESVLDLDMPAEAANDDCSSSLSQ